MDNEPPLLVDSPDDYYEPSGDDLEAADEAAQWRAHEQVEAWVDEHYPFATRSRRRELVDAGEDALSSVDGWGLQFGYGYDNEGHLVGGSMGLSRDAEAKLKATLARTWRQMCDWRRGMQRQAIRPASRTRVRTGRRPRARRVRRARRTAARARGPDSDSAEPPGVAPGGRVLAQRRGGAS